MNCTIRYYSSLILLLTVWVKGTNTDSRNNASLDIREPRVSGRIVKVYSGSKSEPILCPGEGFQPDPVECNVFYRCVRTTGEKFTVFRFQCGPGTIYDPETEICNHPRSTKRSECLGTLISSTEKNNENEIDVDDQHELPSPISIKVPIFTPQKELSTVVTAAPSQKTTKISSSSTSNSWLTSTVKQGSTTRPVRTTFSSQPNAEKQGIQIADPCISEGFIGDSENCHKFYRCVGNGRGGFIRYEFACSDSTVWDDDVQGCNHAWAVKRKRCGRGVSEPKISSTIKTKYDDFTTAPPNLLQTIAFGEKLGNGNEKMIQPQNKSQQQKPIYQQKGKDTNTDFINTLPEIQWSNKSSVKPLSILTPQMKNGITDESQDDMDQGYGHGQNMEITTENNIKCSRSGFMGDKNNCKKFYRCVNNGRGSYIKYEFTCGEGTVWDSKLEACNYASAVKECGGQSYETTTQYSTSITTTTTTTQKYTTTTESTTSNEDENVGYGNVQIETTKGPSSEPTFITTGSSSKSKCSSLGFIGDDKDCSIFYRCVEDGAGGYSIYKYKCGEGTVWDTEINACNHVWAVKKCAGSTNSSNDGTSPITTVSLIQTTTQMSVENDDYDTGYGQQQEVQEVTSGPSLTTTEKQRDPSNNSDKNICRSSGFIGDSQDCKKFYRCVETSNGTYMQYEFSCGEGTVWDPKIEGCNHAWAVKSCDTPTEQIETTKSPILSDEENENTTENKKEENTSTQSTTMSSHKPVTTSLSEESNVNNDCMSTGFMGDSKDCKRFYRCVGDGRGGFIRYEFSCGEGTLWDQNIEACNHASAVKNCKSSNNESLSSEIQSTTEAIFVTHTDNIDDYNQGYGNPSTSKTTTTSSNTDPLSSETTCSNEGFIGDSEDCRKFYRCVDNGRGSYTKYEFMCGEGTTWDEEINGCNHASLNRPCKKESPSKEPEHESDETVTESSTKAPTSLTPDDNKNATTQTPQNTHYHCKSEGFYGDTNDCKKFYRCVHNGNGNYIKYDFTCGDGTIWDQEIQACNHDSENKNCSKINDIQTESAIQNNTSPETGDTISSTENTQATESGTNDYCISEGFYANTNDCKKFYRCVSNGKGGYIKYDFSCGEGTVWVQEIEACDHDNDLVSCSSPSSLTTSRPEITDDSVSPASTSATQSQTPEKQQDEYPNETSSEPSSSEKCTSEGFYANKNDCKKFYRCVSNGKGGYTKYDFTCGEGTAWDDEIQTCNHANEVKSCQEESQTKPTMADEETTDSESTSKSSSSDSSTESSKPENNDNCEQEGYFGNSKDCKKFYRCVENEKGSFTKYDYTCGEGTIWDQDLTTCNHPQDVARPSCRQGDSSAITSTSTQKPSNSTSETSTADSSTQSTSNCSQGDSSKNPSNGNVTCTKAGFYAHPEDCKKFYRCVDWDGDGKKFSVFYFDCGEGTIWDPELETCNYEESVYPRRDCSGKQSQNESTTQESTTEGTTTTTTEFSSESTRPESTTQTKTTTSESTTTDPTTTQQTTSQQTTTEQGTTTEKQTTTSQSTTEQSTTQQQTTTEQTTTTDQSTTSEQTTQQSTTTEQTTTTTTEQTTTNEQTTATTEQTTSQGTTDQSTTEQTTESETTTTEDSTTEHTTESQTSTTEETTSTTSKDQEGTTESDQETTTEDNSSSSSEECPDMEDDQSLYVCPTSFRRHPKYCNMFYQCTEDDDTYELKIAVFKCPNNTIYDESKTQCVEEKKADKKCDGEIAQKRRFKRLYSNPNREPIEVSRNKQTCMSEGHFPFDNNSQCSSAFLKCVGQKSGKLRGYVYRCPDGFVYWFVSRRCEPLSSVKDCKQDTNDWRGRWEIPVEKHNIAP